MSMVIALLRFVCECNSNRRKMYTPHVCDVFQETICGVVRG